jgi:alpha-tubulin suppressor-like RCC1 family protein
MKIGWHVLGLTSLLVLASAACGSDREGVTDTGPGATPAQTPAPASPSTSTPTPTPAPAQEPGAFVVSALSSPNVSEDGTKATFTVKLADKPTGNVTIALAVTDPGEVSLDVALLTFTPDDFGTPKTVTLAGKDDAIADGDTNVLVSFGAAISSDPRYSSISAAPFAITNADNDTPGIFVSAPVGGSSTSETGASVTVNVHLRTKPNGTVSVPVASTNGAEAKASPAGLVFTADDYFVDRVVTITGQYDGVKDADQAYDVTFGKSQSPDDPIYRDLEAKVGLTNKDESVVQLVTDWGAACVRLTSGRVQCWGRNDQGGLGLGDNNNRGDQANEIGAALPYVDLGTGRTAKQLVGSLHSESSFCAIRDDDKLVCWGWNGNSQLGNGTNVNVGYTTPTMGDGLVAVNVGAGRTVKKAALGLQHACAILDDDTLKCWGNNTWGNLGYGDTAHRQLAATLGDALPAIDLGAGRKAKQVVLGNLHTCALLDDDKVKCWGHNGQGQLGYGDNVQRGDNANEMGDNLAVVSLGLGRTAKAITAGERFTCALLDNDTVKCWGSSNNGQLGQNDTSQRGDNANEMGDDLPPVNLGAGRTAKSVIAGWEHTCALLDDATVKCWGRAAEGELGSGDTAARGNEADEMGDKLPVVALGAGRTVTQLATMTRGACVLLDNGWVKCWGHNAWGIVGQGSTGTIGDGANEMGASLPRVPLLW